MGFSNLAETLLDHARAEAKRSESRFISRIHLLSAFRRWSPTQFDEKFPNRSEEISKALSGIKRDGASPDGPDDETRAVLEKIRDPDDVWQIAGELLGLPLEGIGQNPISTSNGGQQNPVTPDVVKHESVLNQKNEISSELVSKIAGVLKKSEDEIRVVIGHDLFVVAKNILSKSDVTHFDPQQFVDFCDIPLSQTEGSIARSSLLTDLLSETGRDADVTARQYALGLVSAASFAASIDANVTQEEIDAIDELRLELRNELSKRISSSSTSHLTTFDELFGGVVGLEKVKKELRQRIDYYIVAQRRKARGMLAL